MYKFAVSLILFSAVTALNPSKSFEKKLACPYVNPVQQFDIAAFGTGIWHEIARYPNAVEVLEKCVSVKYETYDNKVNLRLLNVPANSSYSVEGIGVYADDEQNGNLHFTLSYGLPIQKYEMPVTVLAIDYNNYGIYYSCFKEEKTGLLREYAWIFARTKTLEDHVKIEVENILKINDMLDDNRFIWIDHLDSRCETEHFHEYLNL